MTSEQMTAWERSIASATPHDIQSWLPRISECAAPTHPSSGQYTYLLSLCAQRLNELSAALAGRPPCLRASVVNQ